MDQVEEAAHGAPPRGLGVLRRAWRAVNLNNSHSSVNFAAYAAGDSAPYSVHVCSRNGPCWRAHKTVAGSTSGPNTGYRRQLRELRRDRHIVRNKRTGRRKIHDLRSRSREQVVRQRAADALGPRKTRSTSGQPVRVCSASSSSASRAARRRTFGTPGSAAHCLKEVVCVVGIVKGAPGVEQLRVGKQFETRGGDVHVAQALAEVERGEPVVDGLSGQTINGVDDDANASIGELPDIAVKPLQIRWSSDSLQRAGIRRLETHFHRERRQRAEHRDVCVREEIGLDLGMDSQPAASGRDERDQRGHSGAIDVEGQGSRKVTRLAPSRYIASTSLMTVSRRRERGLFHP